MDNAPTSMLRGKRIVITRAAAQSADIILKLAELGAEVISMPLISFAEPANFAPLDAALAKWSSFNWIIFTSENAVAAVAGRCSTIGKKINSFMGTQVAAVGPATALAAKNAGFRVDHVAETHTGVALAWELKEKLRGMRVFLPRSDRANPDLPATLRQNGAQVIEAIAYRTLPPDRIDEETLRSISAGNADALLFFSPSAVDNFERLAGKSSLKTLGPRTVILAVGPVTASALRQTGAQNIVLAEDTTASAMAQSLQKYFATTANLAGVKSE